jgi:phosphoesterase RecJ-like protein
MSTVQVPSVPRESLGAAVAAIQSARSVVLACHINPDGDALGSLLGLGLALEALGKDVVMLSADAVPETLVFLPGSEKIVSTTERRDFDLAIGLDSGDLLRTGASAAVLESAPVLMDIDHHVTAGRFGDIQLLDSTASATAELVFDLVNALGVGITAEIAECLHCGVLTDTGGFRFTNVTPRTMLIGAALVEAGAVPDRIFENVYERRNYSSQKLLGRALENMCRSDDGRVVWTVVTQADFREFNGQDRDTEGIVGSLRVVDTALVAIVLRERESGKLRVSLRSRAGVDVSAVAARFGGGGHRLAAGCSLDGPPDTAVAALRAALEDVLPPLVTKPE